MDNALTMGSDGSRKEKDKRTRGLDHTVTHYFKLTFPQDGPVVGAFVPKPDKPKVDADYPDQPHGSTNLPEGVVHIFREPPPRVNADTVDDSIVNDESKTELGADENTLAVLAVPSWMTPSDFLSFVEPAAEGVVHLRMIR